MPGLVSVPSRRGRSGSRRGLRVCIFMRMPMAAGIRRSRGITERLGAYRKDDVLSGCVHWVLFFT